jgi:glutamate 5-kinase
MNTGVLVVKIGSSTLTSANGKIDRAYVQNIADQLGALKNAGWSPIVVSSAAISSGLEALGITKRPSDVPSLQAAASVGQCALANVYANAFAKHDIITSLVLLTRRDTADRTAYLHARDTFAKLLEMGVVPIVNENDTVSVEQIKFGDNDTLAALVACLVGASKVVILSDVDGLYDANPATNTNAHLLKVVEHIDSSVLNIAGGSTTTMGSGGMVTKIKAARVLMAAGIPMHICNGRERDCVLRICEGEHVGTFFEASSAPHEITAKKLWIALGDSVKGAVIVDEGAKRALERRGSSLLPVGIKCVEGSFDAGDIVDVKDETGYIFARGHVSASSDEVALGCGRSQEELLANRLLAPLAERPVMHRDELIVFE